MGSVVALDFGLQASEPVSLSWAIADFKAYYEDPDARFQRVVLDRMADNIRRAYIIESQTVLSGDVPRELTENVNRLLELINGCDECDQPAPEPLKLVS